ncbi:MAG TPA: GNAT family N-acetyltransferase [Anaerolineales bacterium]
MSVLYRRSGPEDNPQVHAFWREHWGDDCVLVHGSIYRPEQVDGFIASEGDAWVGLLTYALREDACEIVSLDSLREGEGIGSRLIEQVTAEARRAGCKRLFLITTNDNLKALGFYQRRGFELAAIRPGAVTASRMIKPSIPLVGFNGIPLRDEIELEMFLS